MNILYKYYSDVLDIVEHIENPSIKIASPIHFNDPFEMILPDPLAQILSEQLCDFSGVSIEADEFIQRYKEIYKVYPGYSGVVSLTENHRNILMWAHYANSHKGFCIGYKKDFIAKKLNPLMLEDYEGQSIIYPDRVVYDSKRFDSERYSQSNDRLKRMPIQDIMDMMMVKSNEWIYEKEHRCIIPFYYGDTIKIIGEMSPATKSKIDNLLEKEAISVVHDKKEYKYDNNYTGRRIDTWSMLDLSKEKDVMILKRIDVESISSIYFGCKASYEAVERAIKFVTENEDTHGHIKIYKYEIDKNTFDINEKRLTICS